MESVALRVLPSLHLTLRLTRHHAVLPAVQQLIPELGGHVPALGPCFLLLVCSFLILPQFSFCYLFPQLCIRQPSSSITCTGCGLLEAPLKPSTPASLCSNTALGSQGVQTVLGSREPSHALGYPVSCSEVFNNKRVQRHSPIWSPVAICTQSDLKGFLCPSFRKVRAPTADHIHPAFCHMVKLYIQTTAFSSWNKEELLEFRNKGWLFRLFRLWMKK